MPAFKPPQGRRRQHRIDTIRITAWFLGVHERTLRRWIVERPELRRVLGAYRLGKQWRLDVPKTYPEFERYIQNVLCAVKPFRRPRTGRASPEATQTARLLGFGDKQRERDLLILRSAIELKIADAPPTSVFTAKSKLAEKARTNRASRWVFEARILSAKYGCSVFDVLKHLDRWIAEGPTRQRKNAARRIRQSWPTTAQINKAKGLWKSMWLERTLHEAARECIDQGQRVSGPNLAEFLFHNPYREHAWEMNDAKRQRLGDNMRLTILDPYGKRGISLRLFRQRYDRKDIQKARRVAEGMTQSEQKDGKTANMPTR